MQEGAKTQWTSPRSLVCSIVLTLSALCKRAQNPLYFSVISPVLDRADTLFAMQEGANPHEFHRALLVVGLADAQRSMEADESPHHYSASL